MGKKKQGGGSKSCKKPPVHLEQRHDAELDAQHADLPDVEPALLAVLFSACSAESLLKLEVALSSRIGGDFREHPAQRLNWVRILARDAGLSGNWDPDQGSSSLPLTLSASACKAALRTIQVSTPLDAGWRCLSHGCNSEEDLKLYAGVIGRLHAENPSGRRFGDPNEEYEPSSRSGRVHRLLLAHFDVRDCLAGDSWNTVIDAYHSSSLEMHPQQRRLPGRRQQIRVTSAAVPCIIDGISVPLRLALSTIHGDPELGIFLDICPEAFDPYFTAEVKNGFDAGFRSCRARRQDVIRVVCVLRCGAVQRHSGFVIGAVPDQHLPELLDAEHLWYLSGSGTGAGHALWLDVCPTSGADPFEIDEDVGTAQWNIGAPHGSDMGELIDFPENEFALRPFRPGSLTGKLALVRRGGGIGFAQKALTCQEAGAIGCIIFEREGDREAFGYVNAMGQRFMGRDFPAPDVPCALVGPGPALRLIAAARSGAKACIRIDASQRAMRRLPCEFQEFRRCASRGEPVHCAVLVERAPRPEKGRPMLDWFQGPATTHPLRRPCAAPDSEVTIRVPAMQVPIPAEVADDDVESEPGW